MTDKPFAVVPLPIHERAKPGPENGPLSVDCGFAAIDGVPYRVRIGLHGSDGVTIEIDMDRTYFVRSRDIVLAILGAKDAPPDEDPVYTAELADADIAACSKRRCGTCPADGHHWICGTIGAHEGRFEADFRRDHPQVHVTDALLFEHHTCAHCPAVRPCEGAAP